MLYLCSGHISIISCPTNVGLLSVYNLFSAKKRGGPEKSSQNCLFPAILSFYKHIWRLLCKQIYQILTIIIALFFQFLNKPVIYTVYCFLKGIDIHVLFLCEGHTVFVCPACFDLIITGTVDVTLILNSFLTTLVNNSLLLRCQRIINILVDAEEQAVIDCIPQIGRASCRERV